VLKTYENFTSQTAIHPHAHTGNRDELMYLSLGMVCEAGEVGNKIKCFFFDSTPQKGDKESVLKECGQTLWYLTRLINALGGNVEDVIKMNVSEVKERMKNNAATTQIKRDFYSRGNKV